VTHDRYMLDRVSSIVLGLDGQGSADSFADYSQWEAWQAERTKPVSRPGVPSKPSTSTKKSKLSYLEAREYATIEQRIEDAEQLVQSKRESFEDPAIASDAAGLTAAQAAMEEAQEKLDALYTRWAELEKKNA
jgi:ATP-binding cassette subfamily F protein uup